jgi:hypothetical protein
MSEYYVFSAYKEVEVAITNSTSDREIDCTSDDDSDTKLYQAFKTIIRTDQDITVKYNLATNDSVSLSATEGQLVIDQLIVKSIFITNASGNTANVKVFFLGRNVD